MKPLHSFFVIGLLMLLSNQATANDVIVKGYLKFLNGSPVVNQQVKVSIDSAVSACRQTKLVVTDQNGFYTASLNCSANFARVIIATTNCNGTYLIETPQVPPSGIVEKNFSICNPPPPSNCKAYFKFERLPGTYNIRFNSDSSTGSTSTDNIVKRRWRFGDGTILEGNEIKPLHTFPAKGTYEVCLTIVTAAGCEKTLCQKVIIEEASNTLCKADFSFQLSNSNYKEVKFNSANSSAGPGDQIISRRWIFGDGKEATTIDPIHQYEKDGTYRLCLIIKTSAGCVKEICQTIEIKARKCEAYFAYSLLPSNSSTAGYPVHFNSANSSTNDSIVSRKWLFGDGTTATSMDPLHVFAQPGTYRVCLVIKTKNGCESEICKQIAVGPNSLACAAHFNFERLNPKTIRFNSNMSWGSVGDEIVTRKWDFGDGSSILSGNQVSVAKEYNRPGNYTVCLSIKTAKGCETKVCISVKIEDSTIRPSSEPAIKIVTLYPAPVHTRMTTEVWSKYNNIDATLAVYDIYGVRKWQQKKVLLQGVNVNVVETGALLPGPYFFKVTTMYGVVSKQFYKL